MQRASLQAGLNTCMAIQFVRGGVIKQMCVDAVLFLALSVVLKPGCLPLKTSNGSCLPPNTR